MKQVAIVGASLAGSSLAIRLGRAGVSVLLIDQATFPRRKACGEGLSPLGWQYLRELGFEETLRETAGRNVPGFAVSFRQRRFHFPTARHPWLAIKRSVLDDLVLKKACGTPGVTAVLGQRIKTVEAGNGRCVLQTAGAEQHTAEYLVLAEGVTRHLLRQLAPDLIRIPGHPGRERYGVTIAGRGDFQEPLDAVHILLQHRYQAFCTQNGPAEINVAFLTARSDLPYLRGSLLEQETARIFAALSFSPGEVLPALGLGPLGTRCARAFAGRALFVGDCLECLDPIGGMGMTHALGSSALAAEALSAVLREEASVSEAFERYERRHAHFIRPLRRFTRLMSLGLQYLAPLGALPILSDSRLAGIFLDTPPRDLISPHDGYALAALRRFQPLAALRSHRFRKSGSAVRGRISDNGA